MELGKQEALRALETGIQMEIEGRDFYMKAAEQVSWPEGKNTLADLAKDEEEHIRILKAEHAALVAGDQWAQAEQVAPRLAMERPLPVFEKDPARISGMIDDWANAEDVLDMAIKNEYKSHTFYAGVLNNTENPEARRIFEWLVREEKSHQKTLMDYAKYLGAQSEWLLERERPLAEG